MPGKNVEKVFVPSSYYHVYNRGVAKRAIFKDDDDFRVFLNLLKRYLSTNAQKDIRGREYANFSNSISLVAYALMINHFHLLVYVEDEPELMSKLLRNVSTSYAVYFNKKYKRVGHLFQERYRAVRITEEDQLWHITRYIHLNGVDSKHGYKEYPYSSIGYYLNGKKSSWVKPELILDMFLEANEDYSKFLEEYLEMRKELKELDEELY